MCLCQVLVIIVETLIQLFNRLSGESGTRPSSLTFFGMDLALAADKMPCQQSLNSTSTALERPGFPRPPLQHYFASCLKKLWPSAASLRKCSSQTTNLTRGGDRWPQTDPIQLPIRAVDENVTVDSGLCAEAFEISSAFWKA